MKEVCGIWLPDDDTHFADHLEKGPEYRGAGTYQFKKIQMALKVTKRRRTALDIGAHVGLWSRVLAAEFERVEAFEPVPALMTCFDKNTEHLKNIQLHPCALSDTTVDVFLTEPDGNSGNWHVTARGENAKYAPLTFALDNDEAFELNDVDFIKIDVEGWELHVLRGAEKLIKRDKPVIVIEQKPDNAERYGIDRFAARNLLLSWGAKQLWEKSGDYCFGW